MSPPPVEYGFVCENCKRGRRFGAAKLTAQLRATEHHRRFPDHVVHIQRTEILESLRREQTAVHQLGDEPPF
jgi:hypothetical protein